MKKIGFKYRMQIDFSEDVCEHRFTLKCLPDNGARQTLGKYEYHVGPASFLMEGRDSFGNRYLYGCAHEKHNRFVAEILGSALCCASAPEPCGPDHTLGMYRATTPLTRIGERLRGFIDAIIEKNDAVDVAAYAERVMIAIRGHMTYERGHTDVNTTAEQALINGRGVCQDYVHIFLACMRAKGIACRYAAGLVPGEGETHAWADVQIGSEWHGFDPTNGSRVRPEYLALCYGRDAHDCMINRGICLGSAFQTVGITAELYEEDEE